MGASFFWGILLVIIGLSIIIKVVFQIDIPVFRLIIAFLFIYIGVKVLTGNFHRNNDNHQSDVIFGNSKFSFKDQTPSEQNIVFGRSIIDLRQVDSTKLPAQMEINIVFGAAEIILPENVQIQIKVDAVFSGTTLPNNNTSAFGTTYYETPGFETGKPCLFLKINVVFSGATIRIFK